MILTNTRHGHGDIKDTHLCHSVSLIIIDVEYKYKI